MDNKDNSKVVIEACNIGDFNSQGYAPVYSDLGAQIGLSWYGELFGEEKLLIIENYADTENGNYVMKILSNEKAYTYKQENLYVIIGNDKKIKVKPQYDYIKSKERRGVSIMKEKIT